MSEKLTLPPREAFEPGEKGFDDMPKTSTTSDRLIQPFGLMHLVELPEDYVDRRPTVTGTSPPPGNGTTDTDRD
ncbi:MAG: hypothetical protein ACREGJ_04695 [Candidatus Saccharimonadales bacterium]